ncbi:MAG: 6,7-dimethyl-8-ribityllumazine synthase [Muribaculaceae bacterium]|nr:6,7-dimethyl-8-ribityllumazine synthase [Muribaculaceae bacterium]
MSQNYTVSTQMELIPGIRIAIVSAEWNSHITGALTDGATSFLHDLGYSGDNYDLFQVPGTVELTFAAAQLCKTGRYDAVIIIGCVIRGDTPHFDYVCQSVTQGCAQLNATGDTPVIFCVLTVNNEQQALDRAGGRLSNKGTEAAETALKMIRFKHELSSRAR